MRLKDDQGVRLFLEGNSYFDDLELSAYGMSVVLVGADQQFLETRIGEEDALHLAIDLVEFDSAEDTIHGISCLHYMVSGQSIKMSLEKDSDKIECMFSDAKRVVLMGWLQTFKTFCINRLNETDCILPNQTMQMTEYTINQN